MTVFVKEGAVATEAPRRRENVIAGREPGKKQPMEIADAVKTRVVHLKNAFTIEEMTALDDLYKRLREEDAAMGPGEFFKHSNIDGLRDSNHVYAFFHVNNLIDRELPHILEKILRTMAEADEWDLLEPGGHNVRVMEYHDYMPGGNQCDPHHRDGGSLVTMSIMLSDTSEFTGGEFTTEEEDGEDIEYDFQQGDALVFVSEKYHSVQVVETGRRRTLVTEIWSGARCTIDRDC